MSIKRKRFSKEEQEQLKQNPYTLTVSESNIRHTPEFKTKFWALLVSGKTPRKAFCELGYDPEVLGSKRMERFAYRLRTAYGVTASSISNGHVLDYSGLPTDAAMAAMERELKYLRQENEFLKKLSVQTAHPKERR